MSRIKNKLLMNRSSLARIALVVAAIATLLSGAFFAAKSGSSAETYSNDFNVYYFAAREIIAGHDPYQKSLGEWTPYLYPPLLAELIIPLALVPLSIAAFVWFVINSWSLLAAAGMSAALAADKSKPENDSSLGLLLIAAGAIAVLGRFSLDNFALGQVNPIVAMLAVAHVYLYSRNKRLAAAAAFALAVSIKLTPAILILYHVAKLRLKFAAACVALLAAVTVMSFLQFGSRAPDVFMAFTNRTLKNEQGFDFAYHGNQSLRGAVARLTSNPRADDLESSTSEANRNHTTLIVLLISVALLALAMLAAARGSKELSSAAPLFCCMVMLSPLSWKAHFVILVLPLAYLFARMIKARGLEKTIIAILIFAAFALFNFTSPTLIGLRAAESADEHSLVFFGATIIYLGVVWQATRRFVNLNK